MGKIPVVLLALLLCGCGRGDDRWRTDTVVWIPVDPAQASEAAEVRVPETAPAEFLRPTFPPLDPGFTFTVPARIPEEERPRETERSESYQETVPAVYTEPEVTADAFSRQDQEVSESELLRQINILRQEAGVPALTVDPVLSEMAGIRSREACLQFSHTRPDGRDWATVLTDRGYDGILLGELLGRFTGDGQGLVDGWMQQQTHRENLLSAGCTGIGIGTYRQNGYTVICVLLAGNE